MASIGPGTWRPTSLVFMLAVVWVLSSGGCADAGADHLLLDRFFAASRLLDRTELARYATVVFEPNRDGIVLDFTVVSASEVTDPEPVTSSSDALRTRIAEISLFVPAPADGPATVSDATLTTRHVKVEAQVRTPTGPVTPQTLNVILQRAESRAPTRRRGRWVVTGVRVAG